MTKPAKRRSGDARQRIIDAIIATRNTSRYVNKKAGIRCYLKQYFANIPYEDLEGRCEETMARIALEHLEFGAVRREDEALLRIYNANEKDHGYTSQYTFVEMVNDDMAFLVDSVAAAINRHNLGVHITVHPIIHLRRNRNGKLVEIADHDDDDALSESYIRFAITRETDPKALQELQEEIFSVLSDVRVAVRDWGKMRNRMRDNPQPFDWEVILCVVS